MNRWCTWRAMKKLIKDMISSMRSQSWEFRLFKRAVRKYASPEIQHLIADEYNRNVTEYRKTGKRTLNSTQKECGYCGNANDPDSICKECWDKMGEESK